MPAHPHDPERALTILANSHCPHCVQAVDRLTEWAIEEHIPVAGVDLWQHPEAAEWMEAETSPILVFGGREDEVYAGLPTHDEFHRLASGAPP